MQVNHRIKSRLIAQAIFLYALCQLWMVVSQDPKMDNSSMNKITKIQEAEMLEEIRNLLNLSIEDFVYQMAWPNSKYYGYIKNGRKRPGEEEKKITHPTINKVFTGINYAIDNFANWKENRSEITSIVIKYLMPI